jgi:superfamily II DNA or RNA helicase
MFDAHALAERLGPGSGAELRAWAVELGLESSLAEPARTWIGLDDYVHSSTLTVCFPMRGTVTLQAVLLEAGQPHHRRRLVELKAVLLARVNDAASALARGRAYEEAVQPGERKSALPELEPLADKVRAAYRAARKVVSVFVPDEILPRRSVRTLARGPAPAFLVQLGTTRREEASVAVPLARWRSGLRPSCAVHPAQAACVHTLVALDEVLRLLSTTPPQAELRALVDHVDKPSWARVLDELEAEDQRAVEAEAELSWWIESYSAGHISGVHPVLRRRGKRGEWLTPRAVSAEVARRAGLELEPAERRALDLFGMNQSTSSGLRGFLTAMVDALVDSPRVVLGPSAADARAVRVERLEPRLELVREGTGVELEFRLGELRTPPVEDGAVVFDTLQDRVIVVRVPRTLALAVERLSVVLPELTPEELPALAERVARLDPRMGVTAPKLVPVEEVEAREHWVLRLAARDDRHLELRLFVQPLARGPYYPAGLPPEVALAPGDEGRLRAARRDLAAEQAGVSERWVAWGLAPSTTPVETVQGVAEVLTFLAALRDHPRATVEWSSKPVRVLPRAQRLRLEFASGTDWFGLRGELELEEHRASLALLLDAARQRSPFVRVADDTWLELEHGLLERLRLLEPHIRHGKGRVEVGAWSVPAVAEWMREDGAGAPPVAWSEVVERAHRASALTPAVPPALKAELRDYQLEGFVWMARLAEWGAGAVLADDMGLGKTVQAIAMLLWRAERGPALVLAPTSVTHNWERELARFAPSLTFVPLEAPDEARGPGTVTIVSYGRLLRERERLAARSWATLVIDEAQAIKNPASQRAQAARALRAQWRLALSGTPVENHLGELWSLFAAVSPGLLGSWDHFRDRWASKSGAGLEGLRRLIRPFLLRRTKRDVLSELPPKTEVTIDVELSLAERALYTDARLAAVAHLRDLGEELRSVTGRFQVLAALMRLRQLACDASLVSEGEAPPSSKLLRFVELVRGLVDDGHTVLAFSQFTRLLDRAEVYLAAAGLEWLRLDGSTPGEARGGIVAEFQAGGPRVMLVSLRAGGTGLNLTAADYVIHLDPWWNPAVEDQATDRAHRIGQERPVTVLRLVTQGTVESSILDLHADKRALAAQVFEGGTSTSAALSSEALLALLAAGPSGEAEVEEGDGEASEAAPKVRLPYSPSVEPPATKPKVVRARGSRRRSPL